jgi:hypothetical protein
MSRNPANDHRSRPHVAIPPDPGRQQQQGAQYPFNVSQVSTIPYAFEVTPPSYSVESESLANPWDNPPSTPDTARPRVHSMVELSGRPPSRTASASVTRSGYMAFPEPQIYRSSSSRPTLQPAHTLNHRHSRSELISPTLGIHPGPSTTSFRSTASSYNQDHDSDHYGSGSGDVCVMLRLLSDLPYLISIISIAMTRKIFRESYQICRVCSHLLITWCISVVHGIM